MTFDPPPEYGDSTDIDSKMEKLHLMMNDDDDGKDKLIIGLDFGTTYSGVAYAFTTKSDDIYNINEWPGARGKTSPKCPTLLRYEEPGQMKWGFELDRSTSDRIEAIKLLLDPDQPKPLYVPSVNTELELKRLGKPAIEVATDYIRAIFQHALKKIESKYPKRYLDMLQKSYVLSVPAVWSDKAKDATLRAARNAGLSPVTLIKEPEAAALFTLNQMGKKGLEVGDAIVLCDAGGGTVDLISYEIVNLEPLELKELTTCTGGLAGSLMLNKRFEEWVREVVGERQYVELRQADCYRRALKTFDENIKPGFRSEDDQDEYVNFPKAYLHDDVGKGLTSDTLIVSGRTLHDIFEPIIRDIDKLVNEQIMAVRLRRLKDHHPNGNDISAIFLVGGFGSSAYLCDAIQASNPDIQVIQPNDAWSAIVRGAVMSQLPREAKVTINYAPKHYGVSCRSKYEETRDVGQKRHWDPYEEFYRVDAMQWYIAKGDELHRARKIVFPFFRAYSTYPTEDDLKTDETLVECALDKAPIHYKQGVTTKNVTMKADLAAIPKEFIKKKSRVKKDGSTVDWWEVHYKLQVNINSGPMTFSVLCGGKEYGKADTKY